MSAKGGWILISEKELAKRSKVSHRRIIELRLEGEIRPCVVKDGEFLYEIRGSVGEGKTNKRKLFKPSQAHVNYTDLFNSFEVVNKEWNIHTEPPPKPPPPPPPPPKPPPPKIFTKVDRRRIRKAADSGRDYSLTDSLFRIDRYTQLYIEDLSMDKKLLP